MIPESKTQICHCERCGVPCRVATEHTPEARLLQKSLIPEGYCLSCATARWFHDEGPSPDESLASMIEDLGGPECLRMDHIREQFTAILRVGMSDAKPDEIDWEKVIADWALPFPKKRGKGRKKGGGS